MEIIAPKKMLVDRLSAAASVSDRKSADEKTHRVFMETRADGTLDFRGTDLYRSIACSAGGEAVTVTAPGTVAVPAKDIIARIKCMPDGPVQLETDSQSWVTVRAVGGQRRFRIHGIPGTEFPTLPTRGATPVTLSLPAGGLSDLIRRIKSVVSTDETRPHINSALFELETGLLRLVATDGHRATIAEYPVPSLTDAAPTFCGRGTTMLVPLKGLGDVGDLGEGAEKGGSVVLTVVNNDAFFEVGGVVLSVRLTNSEFVPYRQVVGRPAEHPIRLGRLAFIERVKAVALAANDKTGGITLTAKTNHLLLSATDPDTGSSHDEMVTDYQGPDVTVGVNAKYVLDSLLGMVPREGAPGAAEDEVLLSISGELDPIRIDQGAVDPELKIVSVVMPMRI